MARPKEVPADLGATVRRLRASGLPWGRVCELTGRARSTCALAAKQFSDIFAVAATAAPRQPSALAEATATGSDAMGEMFSAPKSQPLPTPPPAPTVEDPEIADAARRERVRARAARGGASTQLFGLNAQPAAGGAAPSRLLGV
jgi:hypothetical protein